MGFHMISKRLMGELFSKSAPPQGPRIGKYLSTSLYMPGIVTESGMPDDTMHQIRQAYHEVRDEPPVGIYRRTDSGAVHVHIDPEGAPYNGVTEFGRNGSSVTVKRVGINSRVRGRKAKRVAKHEFRHVKSASLLDFMDVSDYTRTLLMESYAEFGGIKASPGEKKEIMLTTPYVPAVKFGMYVDRFYRSEDGSRGYAAFIRDIQKNRSARSTLMHLGRNIKEAIEMGEDPIRATERDYEREMTAIRKAA